MTVKITKPKINVREELNDLKKPTGIAGEAMLRAETPQEQFNLIGAGRRNILINGDFQVSQRGDYTTASSATQSYFVDRWFTDIGSVAYNREQTTGIDLDGTPAISNGVKLTATASGTSYMGLRQKIENPTQYVGRTITYSGYVKSNNPNARLVTFTHGTTQVASSNEHSGSGEWEKLSVTFTMTGNPSTAWFVDAFISTSGISNVAISSGDYLEVTQLQLEVGKVATPFEHRSYGEELALCQRYYYQTQSYANSVSALTAVSTLLWHSYAKTAANWEFHESSLPVTMRAAPTVTLSDVAGTVGKISHATTSGGGYANGRTPYSTFGNTHMVRVSDYNTANIYGFGFEYAVDAEL